VDNAVSALFKLVKFRQDQVGGRARPIVQAVLASLPLQADALEARYLHKAILEWMAVCDARICGEGNANVPKLLVFLASTIGA